MLKSNLSTNIFFIKLLNFSVVLQNVLNNVRHCILVTDVLKRIRATMTDCTELIDSSFMSRVGYCAKLPPTDKVE